MKTNTLFLFFALLLLSCNRMEDPSGKIPADPSGKVPIVFTAEGDDLNASVTTKATEVTSLSSFNVLCVTGTAGSSEVQKFNVSFSGSTTFSGGQFWPDSDPSYKFYASNLAITAASGGPTVSATTATDAVCAFLPSPTYKAESNSLTFNHIFARIGSCNISAPTGYTVSSLSVTVTPKTGGTYNLYSGNGKTDGTGWSSTSDGSATTIASTTGSTSDNNLYLVPGPYTLSASYTLTKGAYSKSFSKSATVSLVAGKINNISSTLPAGDAKDIVFTISITPWEQNSITATFN